MARTLKVVLLTLLGLLLLAVAAGVALLLTFDANQYKGQIARAVEARTGRQLAIEGDLHLTLFPWLGVRCGRVTLGNASGFGGSAFARVEAVAVRVRLGPLLHREVEMGKVVVRGLTLHLARDATGRTNWADLVAAGRPAAEAGKGATGREEDGAGSTATALPVAALAIGGLEVRDAALVWDDRQNHQRLTISDLSLESGPVRLRAPIHLTFSGDVGVSQPSLTGHLEGEVTVTPDLDRSWFRLEGVHLTGRMAGTDLPVTAVRGEVQGTADLDLATQQYRADALHLVLEAEGPLSGRVTVTAGLSADLAKGVATMRDLHLTGLGLDLRGEAEATGLPARPVVKGRLRLAPFDPRALLARLGQTPPETTDPRVLRRASLTTALEAAPDHLRLTRLKVTLDESTITGRVAVRDLAAPSVRGELTLDRIDADRYLPPPARSDAEPKAQATAPVATPAAAAAAAATLPVEPMPRLDVDATVRVGRLKVAGVRLSDLRLTLVGKGGKLRLHPATARLYGGAYAGDTRLDVTGRLPRVTLHDRLTRVHLGPLLKDAMGRAPVTGTVTVEARLSATGDRPETLVATLGGEGRFSLHDGALTGVDVGAILRDAEALLHGRPAARRGRGDTTDFTEIAGTFRVAKGVVTSRDLAGKAPLLRIAGRGKADLVHQEVDYLLTATVVESRTGQGGKELAELKGIPIPIHITGPFAAPQVRPDLRAVVRGRAEKVVQRRLQKELRRRLGERIPEPLQRDLQETLKGLFR